MIEAGDIYRRNHEEEEAGVVISDSEEEREKAMDSGRLESQALYFRLSDAVAGSADEDLKEIFSTTQSAILEYEKWKDIVSSAIRRGEQDAKIRSFERERKEMHNRLMDRLSILAKWLSKKKISIPGFQAIASERQEVEQWTTDIADIVKEHSPL